jgi:hypothetical protein
MSGWRADSGVGATLRHFLAPVGGCGDDDTESSPSQGRKSRGPDPAVGWVAVVAVGHTGAVYPEEAVYLPGQAGGGVNDGPD